MPPWPSLTGPERAKALTRAETTLRRAEKDGVQLLFYTSKRFPSRLKQIPDAPALLYYQGTADLNATQNRGFGRHPQSHRLRP